MRDYPELFSDNVLITCVDVLLNINEADFVASHRGARADLSIALTMNKGVPNEGAYYVSEHGEVIYCDESSQNNISIDEASQTCSYRGSSTGALIANKNMLEDLPWRPEDGPLSLYATVVAAALGRGAMFAFNNGERLFTDVGTIASWNDVQANRGTIAPYVHHAD